LLSDRLTFILGLLLAMAVYRQILEDICCFNCAHHMLTPFRLTRLLHQHIHLHNLIAACSFHIRSILSWKHLHNIRWKEHDTSHPFAKVLPMKNVCNFQNITVCHVRYALCLCSLHVTLFAKFPVCCIVGLREKNMHCNGKFR
jgi:hypothetical protein